MTELESLKKQLLEAENVIAHYADRDNWQTYTGWDRLYLGSVGDGHDVASLYFKSFPRTPNPEPSPEAIGQWMTDD